MAGHTYPVSLQLAAVRSLLAGSWILGRPMCSNPTSAHRNRWAARNLGVCHGDPYVYRYLRWLLHVNGDAFTGMEEPAIRALGGKNPAELEPVAMGAQPACASKLSRPGSACSLLSSMRNESCACLLYASSAGNVCLAARDLAGSAPLRVSSSFRYMVVVGSYQGEERAVDLLVSVRREIVLHMASA